MWWLYPRAFCYAFASTAIYRYIRSVAVFLAHTPECFEDFMDDFSLSKLTLGPKEFVSKIKREKKKLEEYHLGKKKSD